VISARLKILYLIVVAVVCFLVKNPLILSGLLLFHIGLWAVLRLPLTALGRIARKLSFFVLLILITFALIPTEAMRNDVWTTLPVGGFELSINLTGLTFGILMALRLLVVVIASMTVQLSGRPGEFVEGLRALKIPAMAALTIDSTLHLLGPGAESKPGHGGGMGGGGGRGRGGGGGGGRHREGQAGESAAPELTWQRILRGDFSFLIDLIESSLLKAKAHLKAAHPQMSPRLLHDATVISGLCLLMMTAKLFKVLPGIPFAPGHKLVVLVPLYILAAELTYSRWGSTITGTTVGIISFLFGDGRFGIFEIFKHITPGLVVDGALPLLKRLHPNLSRLSLVIVGALCAAVRIATILAVTLLIEAPPLFYVLIVPMFVSQTIFGGLSGFVTFYLLKAISRFRQTVGSPEPETVPPNGHEKTVGLKQPEKTI
jgi:hypothetical protein